MLKSQAEVGLTPLLPEEGAEYLSQGAAIPVQVAARLVGLSEGTLARVSVNGAAPLNLTVSGELVGADIQLPPQPGNVTLVYEAVTSDGRIVASSTRTVKVTGEAEVKVSLLRHEPLDNEANVEPNKPIELYFNKAIDPQKLQVSVRETLHGKTYVNLDAPGVDFLHAKGYQLQDVHRDLESVPAALSLMPGNEAAAISPERHFGFNATVFVEVNYDHQSLGHFQYTVRRLPTFLIGGVIDQFSQPLAGIQVSLPELGRSTTTNTDGSFAFGFQEKPGNELPGGKYQLLVNPDLASPGYGMQIRSVNLQEGRRNEVGRIRLPELTRDAAFEFVGSKGKSTLAGGGLVIDASSATLLFKQGRQEGQLHVQFTPVEETGTPFMPGVLPQWLYALQPRGVKVEGSLGVRIHMPMIDQSYDYLPEGTQWVLLVGYNPAHEIIEPVGVGHIEEHSVVGTAAYASLDFMGYALLAPEYQQKLQDVAEGKSTLQQLMSELQ